MNHIPQDLLKSVFIASPKKPGAVECELQITISLLSHVSKMLLRIVMLSVRNRTKMEIRVEECGFVKEKEQLIRCTFFRIIMERSIELQQDLYLCFIDYMKALDVVGHQQIVKMLEDINMHSKDLRINKNMYWKQTAAFRVDNQIGQYQRIKRGVRQGCVWFPDLFSLHSGIVMMKKSTRTSYWRT